jgi:hypothetical protein
MKEQEGLYRFARFLRQLIVGMLVFVIAVAAFGYLVFMRQIDTPQAWREATRELQGNVLYYGETPEREAHVYRRRPTNYFRGANGVLAATRERLLYVGIEPQTQLTSEDAPATILTSEFPNDTFLTLTPKRLYAFTAHGVIITRDGRHEEYAAMRGHEAELDTLIAYVNQTHHVQRQLASAERTLRAQVAEILRRPLKYEIHRGDALSTIATRFGTTPDQLRAWNHLRSDKVRIRDTLLVKPAG